MGLCGLDGKPFLIISCIAVLAGFGWSKYWKAHMIPMTAVQSYPTGKAATEDRDLGDPLC